MDPFVAVEIGDLEALRQALDDGFDVNSERDGLTLLQYAIDVEADSHTQTGAPLHVDATALLFARGADPKRVPHGGISAEHMAFQLGHWLAMELFSRRG
jgi:hypothetical protein